MTTTRSARPEPEWAERARRAALQRLSDAAEAVWREAAGLPVIEPWDLEAAMRVDKLDAARRLARLTHPQLARVAVAYAAHLSAIYSFGDRPRCFDSATIFLNLLHGIEIYQRSRVEPEEHLR